MKIYVGCALTESPEEFKKSVEAFKSNLRKLEHEALDFLGLVSGEPRDVYLWDIHHCVKEADALIAICDYPAIGLGFEIGHAQSLKKPILALAQESKRVTRLVAGLADVEPNVEFLRYKKLEEDGVKLAADWLDQVTT